MTKQFLGNKPVGQINMRVIKLGWNDAVDAGTCTFTFLDAPNKQTVRARYTYYLRAQRRPVANHIASLFGHA